MLVILADTTLPASILLNASAETRGANCASAAPTPPSPAAPFSRSLHSAIFVGRLTALATGARRPEFGR